MNRTFARRARLATAAVLVTGALAACAPIETMSQYPPSDGIDVDLGSGTRGINLLVVSEGDGEPGRLMGAFANDSDAAVTVSVAESAGDAVTVRADRGEVVYLTADDDAIFASMDAPPGALVTLHLRVGGSTTTAEVPVLDGTLPEYRTAVPTTATRQAG